MKTCSHCHRTYPRPDIQFCLDDGSPLASAPHDTDVEYGATLAPTPTPPPSNLRGGETNPDPATGVQYPQQRDPLATGAQVGEYIIEDKIGEGGMGMIFSASHPVIGKKVAIKVLNPQMANNQDVVARFIQEAKSVNKIRHRNIVDIFSFGTLDDGRNFFAMEFLEGKPLTALTKAGALPWTEAVPIWLEVAAAIEAAHGQDIVHRDLKPDNVFICTGGEETYVKVLDFGIAKLLGDTPAGMTKTSTGMPIGTPAYMSPEQAVGAVTDHRADLYAFGIILFECITGRPPFEGQTLLELLNQHMNEPPPALATLVPIDPELARLVDQLLAKDPKVRPRSMAAVRTELTRLRDLAVAEGKALYGIEAPGRKVEKPRRAPPRRAAWMVAAVATLGAGGAAVALLGKKPAPPPVVIAAPAPVPAPLPAPVPVPTMGKLVLSTNAPSARVFLDKSPTELSTEPVAAGGMHLKVAVPPKVEWSLRVEAAGYKTFVMPLRLDAGDESALPVVMVPVTEKHATSHAPTKPVPVSATKPAAPDKKPTNPNLFDPF